MNINTKRGKMVNGFDPTKVDMLDARTRKVGGRAGVM